MNISVGKSGRWLTAALVALAVAGTAVESVQAEQLAKTLFGAKKLPAAAEAKSYGFYSKGCFSGGVAIATDGPTWQAMRLSRNRRWGHPTMIKLLEKLSREGTQLGWPGLLIGDISQPRGGPMLTGHASHQIGLDADVWFTPMPDRKLTSSEREKISATSMVKGEGKNIRVDDRRWSDSRLRLLKLAASYPEVERILVNPAIKKKLCDTATGDRSWLRKVRPFWGHDYHFHIRIGCQPGSTGCKEQSATAPGDGCGEPLAWWFTEEPWRPNKNPDAPKARDLMTISSLPKACRAVLAAPNPESEQAVTIYGPGSRVMTATAPLPETPAEQAAEVPMDRPPAAASAYSATPTIGIPVPRPRIDVPNSNR
jgi:penicillin-insensitive murein endopeptidase